MPMDLKAETQRLRLHHPVSEPGRRRPTTDDNRQPIRNSHRNSSTATQQTQRSFAR